MEANPNLNAATTRDDISCWANLINREAEETAIIPIAKTNAGAWYHVIRIGWLVGSAFLDKDESDG
jgi:hypothetical protein